MLTGWNMRFRPAIFIWFVFAQFFKGHKNGDKSKAKSLVFPTRWKNDFCRLYRVYQIKGNRIWSALARSLYNLQKSFFHNRKDQAFSFRMSPFFCEIWRKIEQIRIKRKLPIEIAYLHLWALLWQRIRKDHPLIIYLSRETINVANKMH